MCQMKQSAEGKNKHECYMTGPFSSLHIPHGQRDDAYLKHRSFWTCTVSRRQYSKTCSCWSRMCVIWFLLTGLTLFFKIATGTREVVYPFITHNEAILSRSRRSVDFQDTSSLEIVIDRPSDPFVLSLTPSRHLFTAETIIEWVTETGERWRERPTPSDRACLYSGTVKAAEEDSVVALNVCDGFTGLIQIHDKTYFLERDALSPNNQGRAPHLLYTPDEKKTFLSLAYDQDYGQFNNFTRRKKRSVDYDEEGNEVLNTIDEETDDYYIDEDLDDDDDYFDNTIPELPQENSTSPESNKILDHLKPKEDVPKPAAENETSNDVLDWDGYAPDKLWELPEHRPQEARRKKPEEKAKIQDPQKWLEMAIAVDYTVIKFHGRSRVQQYVLTLMNIVSAIYEDPSLEANMRLVISRLVFLEDRKLGQVREGNSKRSLENVNSWNSALLRGDAAPHPHDVAVWLTRLDLGGPSGYAPVSGVCDSERSCSLNRDEGLTSAFIIAHEVGHVLGFSHDGDSSAANDCADEAVQGSVMAPMVAATFSRFHWSKCTHYEYHYKKEHWRCMRNQPTDANATVVKSSIQSSYSLDEQCRMEFGEGYSLCRSFGMSDPCTHLWCGHRSSPLLCKTKKGPPLEGTVCGPNMWCIRGYCEVVGKRRRVESPVARNPRDGEWSAWTEWGSCSRTCGTGVRFRSRKCDNPTPLNGGKPCQGHAEEFDLCNTLPCKKLSDFRAEQCKLLPQIVGFDKKDKRTWLPWQINNETLHCYLTCRAQQTGELFRTQELVIDGTPCSYEDPHKICIQGRCYAVGCDRRIDSNVRENECGVCGGKTGNCTAVNRQYHGRPKEPHRRMVVLPRGARNILIEETPSTSHTLSLMDRKTRKWVYHAPDTRGQDFNDVVITHGTRFIYTSTNGKESLRGQGPLHSDLLLMVIPGSSKEIVHVTATWSVPPKSKTKEQMDENRYVWEMAGWTPCSKTCGGGLQNQVAMCKDLKLNRITKKRYCSATKEEPMANVRFCNVFNCHFRWVVGPWEGCSQTCGQDGVQMRMLYCVKTKLIETMHLSYSPAYSSPNETNKTIESVLSTGSASEARRGPGIENETNGKSEVIPKVSSWNPLVYDPAGMDDIEQFPVYQDPRSFADPALCKDPKPDDIRPCNRRICPGQWKEKEWGPCSQTCGEGVQMATLACEPFDMIDSANNMTSESGNSSLTNSQSQDVDCGPKPDYVRKCHNLYPCKLAKCIKDESHYCGLPNLRRYCIVPEFRRRCCTTCKGYPR